MVNIQIVDKMISSDDNFDPKTGQMNVPEKGMLQHIVQRRLIKKMLELDKKN